MSSIVKKESSLNDINFQQRLLQSPSEIDEEMMLFLEKNPEKIETVKQAKAFDEQIKNILKVDVPEGLADKIIIKNNFNKPANDNNWFKNSSIIAASLLVVFVGLWSWQLPNSNDLKSQNLVAISVASLNNAVIEHIIEHAKEDPFVMYDSIRHVDSDKAEEELFSFVGATLNKPMDLMTYAGPCEINGQRGLHVVIQEEDGPVTVIVLPGNYLDVMHAFRQDGFVGRMIPVNGAVVAIVGTTELQIAMAQMRFFKAVQFG